MDNQSHAEPHVAVNLAHPLGVALGQVVVDGDDVDALAGQGVEVGGKDGHQGLAFAGLHLGDPALVEDDAADQLDPIGPHAQHPPGSLPDCSKGVGQDVVQALPCRQPVLEFLGLGPQGFVVQSLVCGLKGLDLIYNGAELFDLPLRGGSK